MQDEEQIEYNPIVEEYYQLYDEPPHYSDEELAQLCLPEDEYYDSVLRLI